MLEEIFTGNKKFQETFFKDNIAQYRELAGGEKPKVLWIGCSDARIQTGHITNAPPGTLYIHRNMGNIAPNHDWNFAAVLEYAIIHLKVEDVVICGHSECDAIRALDEDLKDAYIPLWLNEAREAKGTWSQRGRAPFPCHHHAALSLSIHPAAGLRMHPDSR